MKINLKDKKRITIKIQVMKKYTLLFIGILALAAIQSCNHQVVYDSPDQFVDEALPHVEMIGVEGVKSLIDEGSDYLLIDVRGAEEHHPGYIPGSVNVPRGTLEFNMGKNEFWEGIKLHAPKKDANIVVYCKKGQRSILAAYTLKKMGFTKVRYMEGGYKNWEMNYPMVYDKDDMSHDDHAEAGGC